MKLSARLTTFSCIAALGASALVSSGAGAGSALPERSVPSGLHAIAGKAGGRIIEGTLAGAASSDRAFRAGLARARQYFDRPPHVLGAVRSNDQTLTLALFKATLAGTPVGGYILTTFVPHGPSRLDVLFDRIDRAGRSVNPMLAQISARERPAAAGASASAVPAMKDVASPDGTVHARLPADWHTTIFAQGEMAAVGPDKAEVDQEIALQMLDPNGSLYQSQQRLQASMGGRRLAGTTSLVVPFTNDVEAAYKSVYAALVRSGTLPAAQISFEHARTVARNPDGSTVAELVGTSVAHGTTSRFDGQVLVSPPNPYGGWTMSVKMISAPEASYKRDLPTLLAIFQSYNVDQHARNQQVASSLEANREGMARGQAYSESVRATMSATFDASMSHARSVQSGIDRSTSGFVHYLNDTTVVESAGGGRSSVDASFAQSVVDNDPQNFRIVPVSEYRSGD